MAFSSEDILLEFEEARMLSSRPNDDTEIEFRLIQRAEKERLYASEYEKNHRAMMGLSAEWRKKQCERFKVWRANNKEKRSAYQHEYNRRDLVKLREKDRNKRRRDTAVASGKCRYCLQRPACDGKVSCRICYQKYWDSPEKRLRSNARNRARRSEPKFNAKLNAKRRDSRLSKLRGSETEQSAIDGSAVNSGSVGRTTSSVPVSERSDIVVSPSGSVRIVRRHGAGQERYDVDLVKACG